MEHVENTSSTATDKLSFNNFREEVLQDYRVCCESREGLPPEAVKKCLPAKLNSGSSAMERSGSRSLLGNSFEPSDFLSGYYRDQTFAFATKQASVEEFFSQVIRRSRSEWMNHTSGRAPNELRFRRSQPAMPTVNWLDPGEPEKYSRRPRPYPVGQMPPRRVPPEGFAPCVENFSCDIPV